MLDAQGSHIECVLRDCNFSCFFFSVMISETFLQTKVHRQIYLFKSTASVRGGLAYLEVRMSYKLINMKLLIHLQAQFQLFTPATLHLSDITRCLCLAILSLHKMG